MEMMKGDVKQAARHMNTFNTASYLGVLNESRINGILFSPISWTADAVGSAIKTAWLPIDQMVVRREVPQDVGRGLDERHHKSHSGVFVGKGLEVSRIASLLQGLCPCGFPGVFKGLFRYAVRGDDRRPCLCVKALLQPVGDECGYVLVVLHALFKGHIVQLSMKRGPEVDLLEELLSRQEDAGGEAQHSAYPTSLTAQEFFNSGQFRIRGLAERFVSEGLEVFIGNLVAHPFTRHEVAPTVEKVVPRLESLPRHTEGIAKVAEQCPKCPCPLSDLVHVQRNGTPTPGLNLVSSRYREALAKGGEEAARAKGQMATGCLLWASAGMLAYNGIITGSAPKDPKLRKALEATGWQPYSIKVGDTYVSYRRYDPIGMFLGMAADFNVIASEANERDAGQIASAMAAALTNNLSSKTYLQGLAETLEVLQDPARHGERYAGNMLSSFVPMTSLLRFTRQNMTDDAMRETRDIMDYVMNGLPGLSDTLPARHSWITGEAVNYQMFPKASDNMVLRELANMADRGTIGAPSKDMRGVELTTAQLSRLNEIHGTVRIQGKTMQEALERLFLSPSYDLSRNVYLDPPKGGELTGENISPLQGKRAYEINKVIRKYRKAAQNQLMKEDTELSRMVALRNRNVKLARDGKTDGGGERSPFRSLLEYY